MHYVLFAAEEGMDSCPTCDQAPHSAAPNPRHQYRQEISVKRLQFLNLIPAAGSRAAGEGGSEAGSPAPSGTAAAVRATAQKAERADAQEDAVGAACHEIPHQQDFGTAARGCLNALWR